MNTENATVLASTLPDITKSLETTGFAILRGQHSDMVDLIVASLGTTLQIDQVTPEPDSKRLFSSHSAMPVHTDHPLAKYIVWHCARQAEVGGESLLVDLVAAYEKLRTDQTDRALTQVLLGVPKYRCSEKSVHPMLTIKNGRLNFYYVPWLVIPPTEQVAANVLSTFCDAIAECAPSRFLLAASDVLIVDNTRIAHGRTAFSGKVSRLLHRFWIH